jgi:elongation factor Ts
MLPGGDSPAGARIFRSKTMTVTAQMVKELREATGAGMMDVKKALTENNGDMDAAVDWLRTKGLAKAAKKADRVAAEGLVGVAVSNGRGVAVEINSETDFVAKNADFQSLVREVARVALTTGDSVEVVKAADLNGKTVDAVIQESIARIGENMTFRRLHVLEGDTVVSYVHNAAATGMGKIGVLVALKGDKAKAEEIGKQFAMHIAATAPLSLSESTLDPVVLERELAVQTAKALEENASSAKPKPDAVIHNNIIPGRMKRFLAENTLLGQAFVINPDLTIEAAAKEAGVEITGYARVMVGEGVEKKEEDFAAEVAKALQG